MIRKRLQNRTLPDYNLAEELINSISHGLGAVFGIIVLILLIIKAIKNNSVAQLITGIIYSFSLIALYTCSTVYHAVTNEFTKKIMQIIDHCMIYILIGRVILNTCLQHHENKPSKIYNFANYYLDYYRYFNRT